MSALRWLDRLSEMGKVRKNEPMSRHTTLGVGGCARWYFRPSGLSALCEAMRLIPLSIPIMAIGRGSNLLVADEGFQGVVIDMRSLNGIAINGTRLIAEAGARMSKVAQATATAGLSGLEFMATVPGSIGGGVAMNAGAFGQQVSDTLTEIEILERSGDLARLSSNALHMGYRQCNLPANCIVVRATFVLQPCDPKQIQAQIKRMRDRRSATQPLASPNCGSVFKNPAEGHAAELIERTGLKGFRIGGARISEVHANFIVTEQGARASDVLALIHTVQQKVWQCFGIRLEPEVRIVGGRM